MELSKPIKIVRRDLAPLSPPKSIEPIALVGGRVFADSFAPESVTVLLTGERITAVAAPGTVDLTGFKCVDISGLTVLPGMVDLHTHLSFSAKASAWVMPTGGKRRRTPAEVALQAGITTARDMGGVEHTDLVLRDDIAAGLSPGPRMLSAGKVITRPHGYLEGMGVTVGREEDLAPAVQGQIDAGADHIKVIGSGGITGGMRESYFSEREYQIIARTAAASNIPVAVHAQCPTAIQAAVRAGVASIEHGSFLNQKAASMMVDSGTFLVPTFAAYSRLASDDSDDTVSVNARDVLRHKLASFQLALEHGVRWGLGSDAVESSPHDLLISEAEFFVDVVGVSTTDVLQALGRGNATLLNLESEIGNVAPGMRADLILVRGEPLRDIAALRNVVTTYSHGMMNHWQNTLS